MEIPNKIYIHVKKNKITNTWNNTWIGVNDIEYVRKDTLIKKACEGIENLLSGYIIRNFHFGDSYEMDTLIEDFKKYMREG